MSVPPEVEQAIDKRSGMAAVGNLNDFVKYQMAQGFEKGGPGVGGVGAEMAVGMAMAQQMMNQPGGITAQSTAPAAGAAQAALLPEMLSPADAAKALGVSEADVIASLEAGDLKGKKIGTQWRITRAAAERVPAVAACRREPYQRSAGQHNGVRPRRGRSVEVPLPGVRRRSQLESHQARAGLSVLRHRIAGRAEGRATNRPPSSSTIWPRRCARFRTPRAGGTPRRRRSVVRAARRSPSSTPDKVGQRCEFCGSAQLVPYEQVKDAFTPESLLPLKVDEPGARELIRTWYRSRWFAPNKLRTKALTDTAKGVYIPYWTFDANVYATWTAESGTYTGKDRKNIRWRPVSGVIDHFFDDELVAASKGMNPAYLRAIEPFPTGTLIPYDPGYLAGWTVERYQIDLVNAASQSRRQMEAATRSMCARQIPGDTHRNLVVNSTFSDQKFKHILVPVWLLTYTFRSKTYQVVVNGVTGKTDGVRPWSWIKISLAVLAALIVWYIAATN